MSYSVLKKNNMEERFCYWVLTNMITPRPRKTKAMLEHELNEIYHLLDDGIAPQEIKRYLAERGYTGYRQHLRDLQSKHQGYILEDLAIAKERLLVDMRRLREIITNPNTSTMVKLRAAKADFHLNIALLKLEYEGILYVEDFRKHRMKEDGSSS
jgi:hypothetical protein